MCRANFSTQDATSGPWVISAPQCPVSIVRHHAGDAQSKPAAARPGLTYLSFSGTTNCTGAAAGLAVVCG